MQAVIDPSSSLGVSMMETNYAAHGFGEDSQAVYDSSYADSHQGLSPQNHETGYPPTRDNHGFARQHLYHGLNFTLNGTQAVAYDALPSAAQPIYYPQAPTSDIRSTSLMHVANLPNYVYHSQLTPYAFGAVQQPYSQVIGDPHQLHNSANVYTSTIPANAALASQSWTAHNRNAVPFDPFRYMRTFLNFPPDVSGYVVYPEGSDSVKVVPLRSQDSHVGTIADQHDNHHDHSQQTQPATQIQPGETPSTMIGSTNNTRQAREEHLAGAAPALATASGTSSYDLAEFTSPGSLQAHEVPSIEGQDDLPGSDPDTQSDPDFRDESEPKSPTHTRTKPRHHRGSTSLSESPTKTRAQARRATARGPWNEEEEEMCIKLMRDLKDVKNFKGTIDDLWYRISGRMRHLGYERSPAAVKNMWNRKLRHKSGFDERFRPKPHAMITGRADSSRDRGAPTPRKHVPSITWGGRHRLVREAARHGPVNYYPDTVMELSESDDDFIPESHKIRGEVEQQVMIKKESTAESLDDTFGDASEPQPAADRERIDRARGGNEARGWEGGGLHTDRLG